MELVIVTGMADVAALTGEPRLRTELRQEPVAQYQAGRSSGGGRWNASVPR